MRVRTWLLGLVAAALFACGGNNGGNIDANGGGGDGDGGGGNDDGGVGTPDAPFSGMCTPGGTTQCSDCIDNDDDGKIDGFDPECTGPADNDESSFKTGIPGDNIDATWQDCFFDGNSGAGDDGCNQHVCCLLQVSKNDCPIKPAQYNQTQCYQPFGNTAVPQKCIDKCGKLTPPGCDCFGCCTICGTDGCADVIINPAVSPNCDQDNITHPGNDGVLGTNDDPCRKCVKNTMCGPAECGGQTCILCPGQDPSTLPPSCNGATCPSGITPCDQMGNCAPGTYCSNGCCIGSIL